MGIFYSWVHEWSYGKRFFIFYFLSFLKTKIKGSGKASSFAYFLFLHIVPSALVFSFLLSYGKWGTIHIISSCVYLRKCVMLATSWDLFWMNSVVLPQHLVLHCLYVFTYNPEQIISIMSDDVCFRVRLRMLSWKGTLIV